MGKITISLDNSLIVKIRKFFPGYGEKSVICQRAFKKEITTLCKDCCNKDISCHICDELSEYTKERKKKD